MPNSLAAEKSPYLLQHAENPVNWLPWGERAFSKARAEDKPVFLSIGYSTCHWCHVMAHESFENPTIAAELNEHFVPVKVDREERPDVDRIYMTYVQAMTGHGGWPLNAWLTPELKPFHGGTYYPPEDRDGRTGLESILRAIARGWRDDRERLVAEAERTMSILREQFSKRDDSTAPGPRPDSTGLVQAASKAFERGFAYCNESFDPEAGGFGGAPKFPRASNLSFLFRVAVLQGMRGDMGATAIAMATRTLECMARGGIHDHVGGGFHRYSVDEHWFVPHFEKMLYDQAQITVNCLEAYQGTHDERFAWLARDVLEYVARDLTGPDGEFHTAEDADCPAPGAEPHVDTRRSGASAESRGARLAEGRFYLWTREEIESALGQDAALFCAHFGIRGEGNVPAHLDPHGEFRGRNIIAQRRPLVDTARAGGITPQQANDILALSLDRLRTARARRLRPLRDDKVVTAENGLMISAFARAHQVLVQDQSAGTDRAVRSAPTHLDRAVRATEFILRQSADPKSGKLFRCRRNGPGGGEGFAVDYAYFVQALLDLYEASFDFRWLELAERFQETMDAKFGDADAGGYYDARAGDAAIILRLKEDYDGAEPAPTSVAAANLFRLSAMLNSPALRERGIRATEAFRVQWSRTPQALPQMLCAIELAVEPPRHIVIAGNPAAAEFRALAQVVHSGLGPRRTLLAADGGEGQAWLARRAPWIGEMRSVGGRPAAYVCEDFTCRAPVTAPEELRRILWEQR